MVRSVSYSTYTYAILTITFVAITLLIINDQSFRVNVLGYENHTKQLEEIRIEQKKIEYGLKEQQKMNNQIFERIISIAKNEGLMTNNVWIEEGFTVTEYEEYYNWCDKTHCIKFDKPITGEIIE